MTVFRGYLLIMKRNIWTILMYVAIFISITVMIQNQFQDTAISESFQTMKLNVAVVNRDGGILGESIRSLIEQKQNLVELEDEIHVMQEALYYRNVEYILIIPEGTQEKLSGMSGVDVTDLVQSVAIDGSASTFYVESQVNSLMNQIRVYLSAGYSLEEACASALTLWEEPATVTMLDTNGNAGVRKDFNYCFRFMPYAFLGAAIMSISNVIIEFKKKEIERRMQSSAATFSEQNLSSFAACLVIGILIWGICIIYQAIQYRGGAFLDRNAVWYLLNSISCMLVALSLGYLTGMAAKGPTVLSGINNVVSLGMCFLGGIFVPLEMFGGAVRTAAQLLPTYWYSVINGILGDYEVLSPDLLKTVYQGILIQVLFAAACFSIALVVRRMNQQARA